MEPPIVRKAKAKDDPVEQTQRPSTPASARHDFQPGTEDPTATPSPNDHADDVAKIDVVTQAKRRATSGKHSSEPRVIEVSAEPSEAGGASESTVVAASAELAPADGNDDENDPVALGLSEFEEVAVVTDRDLEAIYGDVRGDIRHDNTTALAIRDPLGAYMAEVRRHPLLTRDEEYELAKRWVETNDPEAGRKLVTSNLRLVVKIANEYRRGYQNLLDLVQEGNVGLVKAVQKFDPYRGVKLSTYAGWWIRAYILKYILDTWRLVKVGTTQNQRKLFFNLRKQRDALRAAGIEPTPEQIAKALDVSTEEVVEMQKRLGAPDQSLDAPINESDEGSRTRIDLVEDEGADPEDRVGSSEFMHLLSDKLRRFGQTLSGREREIFEQRVIADEPITLQELGDRWGVSRERARQLEKRMVTRLREFLQDELGDAVQVALGQD